MKLFDRIFDKTIPRAVLAIMPPLRRTRDEMAFLPAALEILDTPASPLGRAIGGTIIGFFCMALIWSIVSRVDIVATATGKVVPTGNVKVLQPLESGMVTAIHVQDGDHVVEGQVLVELDAKGLRAERDKIADRLLQSQLEAAQLKALKAGIENGDAAILFTPPSSALLSMIERARSAVAARDNAQSAKCAGLARQIAGKSAEAEEITATIGKLQASLPLLAEQAEVRKQAMNIQYGNKLAYFEIQQRLVEQQHDLIIQLKRVAETDIARQALEQQLLETRAEYARSVFDDLGGAEQRISEQKQDLIKAEDRLAEMTLTAPIAGTVQQLAIHTIGGVVTPAQPLLVVVPDNSQLAIEATVQNRDVGFVQIGDDVEIKVETFTFTRYGLLHGKVVGISRDTVTDHAAQPSQRTAIGNNDTSTNAEPSSEPGYVARIKLTRSSILFDGKEHPIGPGMAVTAEIKTGQRHVIDYILSPIRGYQHDALTEQ
jgi:hemolysin D